MVAVPASVLCFTLLLSLVCLCSCSTSCSTAELARTNLLDDSQCVTGNRKENNGVISREELSKGIKMELMDSNPDILTVTFPLAPPTNYTTYMLELYVALFNGEDLTEEKCSQINFSSESVEKHSSRYFDIYSCKELDIPEENCTSTCSVTGVVQFRHIFSGCYQVKFNPMRNGGTFEPYRSKNTVLRNNFGLKRLTDLKPTVQHVPTQKDDNFSIHFTNFTFLFAERLKIKFRLSKLTCIYEDRRSFMSWVMALNPSDELQCEVANVSTKTPSCEQEGVDYLKCIFYNVSAGNYCLTMEVEDPVRCSKGSSVWMPPGTTQCLFFYNFTLTYSDNLNGEPSTESSYAGESYIVVICAVIALIILVAVIFVGLRFFRADVQKIPPSYLLPLSRQSSEIQPQVLLLYAQDCQPFMKLMATFRGLLRNVGNCEVFDCFDPARAEEIALSPIEWMRYRVNNPTLKVVVVASDCAVAHQRALEAGIRLQYCQPLPYNMLFQHGLKTLTYDSDHKEYLKNFVVSFDDKALNYVTPFTRFSLPLHLWELLRNLNQGIGDVSLQDSKDVQKLKDDLSDYLLYKRQNSSYLGSLVMRSPDAV